MRMEELLRKRLYHITDWRNLPSILLSGQILSRSELTAQNISSLSAAHEHINERRTRTSVPVGPQGALTDYLPLSFAPRSPMLCAIANGRVSGVEQKNIVHLSTNIERIITANLSFVFSNGHPAMELSEFYDHIVQLDTIDWELMKQHWWNNTDEDGDRSRRRQAEFLIHRSAPWSLIQGIGVCDESIASLVRELFVQFSDWVDFPVRVLPNWYYT